MHILLNFNNHLSCMILYTKQYLILLHTFINTCNEHITQNFSSCLTYKASKVKIWVRFQLQIWGKAELAMGWKTCWKNKTKKYNEELKLVQLMVQPFYLFSTLPLTYWRSSRQLELAPLFHDQLSFNRGPMETEMVGRRLWIARPPSPPRFGGRSPGQGRPWLGPYQPKETDLC